MKGFGTPSEFSGVMPQPLTAAQAGLSGGVKRRAFVRERPVDRKEMAIHPISERTGMNRRAQR
jgi:hypothetical protein